MPKVTMTSAFASSLIVGDPGVLTVTLAPKETKAVNVTDVQLRQLLPGLEKLKTMGWLDYSVMGDEETTASVPPALSPAPPVIEPVMTTAVETPVAAVVETEVATVVETEVATTIVPAAETVVTPTESADAPPDATTPVSFKKNRNR